MKKHHFQAKAADIWTFFIVTSGHTDHNSIVVI